MLSAVRSTCQGDSVVSTSPGEKSDSTQQGPLLREGRLGTTEPSTSLGPKGGWGLLELAPGFRLIDPRKSNDRADTLPYLLCRLLYQQTGGRPGCRR